jgi:hypothetical protein
MSTAADPPQLCAFPASAFTACDPAKESVIAVVAQHEAARRERRRAGPVIVAVVENEMKRRG